MLAVLRRCRFAPYRKGMGPTFTLTIWEASPMQTSYYGGRVKLGYRLTMREGGKSSVLFEGEDFSCASHVAIDSDECVRSLMTFLTLRPGDIDSEYFANYTPAQLEYCQQHAEALDLAVTTRFGFGDY